MSPPFPSSQKANPDDRRALKTMKLWREKQGRDARVDEYTAGNDPVLDLELVPYDCLASIAHARMLRAAKVISAGETLALEKELRTIMSAARAGRFKIRPEEEDGHTAIENRLVRRLGGSGKKIHTARSRNDQVLVALRLYSRDKLDETRTALARLVETLNRLGKTYRSARMPGYTHARKAMPYSVGRYFRAFADALKDDLALIASARRLNDQNPLGTAAGYGVPLAIDRELTTRLLGFRKTQRNALYTQNSRGKFEAVILFVLSQVMLDLQRLAHDLILFSMDEFGFFILPERFCTGSSIMPQKKNPDVLELVRASLAVVHSGYFRVMEILKGLPSGYHRDLQLTKEPLILGFKHTLKTIGIVDLVLGELRVDKGKCRRACTEEVYAAEQVYRLVGKGIAFRDAYRKISRLY